MNLRKRLREFRNWIDNAYFSRFYLRGAAFIIIGILAGFVGIFYIAEPLFDYIVRPYVYFSVSQSDWDGIAVIWTAEVPLAFLLRNLFGDTEMNWLEYDLNLIQALQTARQMEGIEEKKEVNPYAHLKVYQSYRNWPGKPLVYVINVKRKPQEAYLPFPGIFALSHAGIIGKPKSFDTIQEMEYFMEEKERIRIKRDEHGKRVKALRADLDI